MLYHKISSDSAFDSCIQKLMVTELEIQISRERFILLTSIVQANTQTLWLNSLINKRRKWLNSGKNYATENRN